MTSTTGESARTRRWVRVVRWLLLAPLVFYVLIIAAVNLALWTGLVERLVSKPRAASEVQLRLDRAWAIWPTHVHIRGLELNVDAVPYQLRVVVPHGRADISLWALTQRTFRTRAIDAKDATVILLLKMDPEKVSPQHLAQWPKISDFGAPIRSPDKPDRPPRERAWSIDLQGMDARLLQFWFNDLRLWGPNAHLQGGLHSIPGYSFSVSDTRLAFENSTVSTASAPAALTDADGQFFIRIEDNAPAENQENAPPPDADILKRMRAELLLDATVESLELAQPFIPPSKPSIGITSGQGTLRVDASLEHGYVGDGSSLALDIDNMLVRVGSLRSYANLEMQATTRSSESEHADISVDLKVDGLRGFTGASGEPIVHGDPIRASVVLEAIASLQMRIKAFELHVPRLIIESLSPLASMAAALESLEGRAKLALKAKGDDKKISFHNSIALADLDVKTSDVQAATQAELTLDGVFNLETRRVTIDPLEASLKEIELVTQNGHSTGAWLTLRKSRVTIDRHGSATARLVGKLDDLRLILTHLGERRRLLERVKDRDVMGSLDFNLEVDRKGTELRLQIHELSRPSLQLQGLLLRVGTNVRYAILLERLGVGLRGYRSSKDRDRQLVVGVDGSWIERERAWIESLDRPGDGT